MATTDDYIANEARRQELRIAIAKLTGAMDVTASVQQRLATLNNDKAIERDEKLSELASLEAGAGPGIMADFGRKSAITQLIEAEREAAKSAAIDYVKANPECTEDAAGQAWDEAALAAHPDFAQVIQHGTVMLALYRANMAKANMIPDTTWESQRAWVLATDKAEIMGM